MIIAWLCLTPVQTINVINANYAIMLDLPMGPLSNLRESLQGVKVHGNTFAGALGYVIVCIRFNNIKGYNEDQYASLWKMILNLHQES